jgi:hypothetical protein
MHLLLLLLVRLLLPPLPLPLRSNNKAVSPRGPVAGAGVQLRRGVLPLLIMMRRRTTRMMRMTAATKAGAGDAPSVPRVEPSGMCVMCVCVYVCM